jgi:hypothetical protein
MTQQMTDQRTGTSHLTDWKLKYKIRENVFHIPEKSRKIRYHVLEYNFGQFQT